LYIRDLSKKRCLKHLNVLCIEAIGSKKKRKEKIEMGDWEDLIDLIAEKLRFHKFTEIHKNIEEEVTIAGVIIRPQNILRAFFTGGYGLCIVVEVPEEVRNSNELNEFYVRVRKVINRKYARFPWFKCMYSFMVLLFPHALFETSRGIVKSLKDRSGAHMNIIQGVAIIDKETFEIASDYTWIPQHKKHFQSLLDAVQEWSEKKK